LSNNLFKLRFLSGSTFDVFHFLLNFQLFLDFWLPLTHFCDKSETLLNIQKLYKNAINTMNCLKKVKTTPNVIANQKPAILEIYLGLMHAYSLRGCDICKSRIEDSLSFQALSQQCCLAVELYNLSLFAQPIRLKIFSVLFIVSWSTFAMI